MIKEWLAKIRGKKQSPTEPAEVPAPVAPAGLFWYNVVQPGEAYQMIYVVNRQQREVTRYQVWVN